MKKLYKRCTEQITIYANGQNQTFKEINKEDTKSGVGVYPKVTMTHQLFNKDGSIALNDEDNQQLKDKAKKELIELKGYLDMGIITQKEFDKKVESLKKILLGN
jgi:lysyl-tRNA synthetase class II